MKNNTLNIRSKRALLNVLKVQLELVSDYDMSMKKLRKLKKDKSFRMQAKWIDSFVQKNFQDIPVLKNKLYTKKDVAKQVIKKILYYLLLVFTLQQTAAASHFFFFRGENVPNHFFFNNIYTNLINITLLIGLYVYVNYYPGLNIEKNTKSKKMPIFEYEYFLIKVKETVESMPEKEINDMLRCKVLLTWKRNGKYTRHSV